MADWIYDLADGFKEVLYEVFDMHAIGMAMAVCFLTALTVASCYAVAWLITR